MYTVHLGTLGIIHNFQWIAVIVSRLINNTIHIIKFLGRIENSTLVAVMFIFSEVKTDNVEAHQSTTQTYRV
jgi:hypothetical protein